MVSHKLRWQIFALESTQHPSYLLNQMLDDCAFSFCRVCAIVNIEDWEEGIDGKKVSFQEIRDKGHEAIRGELVGEKLRQLERESLLKKVDLLFTLCPPPEGYAPIGSYTFDRARLLKIDNIRHRIIHETRFGSPR
jgi:hypothetical protein